MNYEESKKIDKAVQAAFHEVFNEDLEEDIQYKAADRFYDLNDVVVFSDGENEIDFEAGFDLAIKWANMLGATKVYKSQYDEQTFYFIGMEEEVIKKLNTIFDCWCSNETLMRSGCECGGN